MSAKQATVLVADDDPRILRMINRILELEGHRVIKASDGQSALRLLEQESPDLILLDIMMPAMDGYTVCKRIREFSQTPIIMVTAKGDDEDKVRCLDSGADDYITKPFSSKELAARVRVALRHAVLWDEKPEPGFTTGDLTIDFARHRVTLKDKELNLTATEYRLLSFLARNADRVLTPDQILQMVWSEDYMGEVHLLQVTIARLRQKLEDDARKPRYILTRSGIGYMMTKDA